MADIAKTKQKVAPAKKAVAKPVPSEVEGKVTKKDAVTETVAPVEAEAPATKKVAKPAKAKAVETPKVETVEKTAEPAVEVAEPVKTEAAVEATPAPTKQPNNSTTQQQGTYSPEFDLTVMLETGAHFGHQARRWHPKMAPYIYQKRDGVHIIDLIKTAENLTEAAQFVYELGKNGKSLIFVGTKRQAQEIIKAEAVRSGAMYIINRWMGGFISNWEQIGKSIRRMMEIRKGLEAGTFIQYTKKERVVLDKEAQRLERFFAGVSDLKTKPDALFIVDLGHEKTALKEASEAGIPIIGLVDTNDDPTDVDYVIPANDDAVKSIEYFVKAIADAYEAGRSARK